MNGNSQSQRWRRAAMVIAACALVVAGCVSEPSPEPLPPVARGDPVSIYMQNLTGEPIEFTMRPIGDPPVIFAVDRGKVGAGCTRLPANWQMAQTEAGKGPGQAAVLRVVAQDRPGGVSRTVWVSVNEAGFTSGAVEAEARDAYHDAETEARTRHRD